jgi:hypothetical protein
MSLNDGDAKSWHGGVSYFIYLFLLRLFNVTFSSSDNITSNMMISE